METLVSHPTPTPPPPPPPPKPRKTGLIIGIFAGVLVVLCVCVAVIAGVIAFRDQIPGISGLFATPTPEGVPYANAEIGVNLVYPVDWYVEDDGSGIIIIANSEEAALADDPAEGDAFVAILRDSTLVDLMFAGADMTSAASMRDSLMSQGLMNLDSALEMDRIDSLNVGGYAAAAGIYSYQGTNFRQVNYLVIVNSGDLPTTIFFSASETYWQTFRPVFDAIRNTITFDF